MRPTELETLDGLGAIAVVIDLHGAVVGATRAFVEASGHRDHALRGRALWELVDPADAETIRRAIADHAADRRPCRLAACLVGDGGVRTAVAWSCSRLEGRDQLLAFGVDITAMLEAREEAVDRALSTHSQALMSMPDAVNLTDLDGVIRFTNSALDAMFGYREGELLGQPVSVLNAGTPDDSAQQVATIMRDLELHGRWQGEFRNRRKDGATFYTRAHISTLQLPEGPRWISVQTDITERKRTEQAIREADTRKTEFLAALSHELRNPLAPIRNALAILEQDPTDSERTRNARAILDRQVTHLVHLVDDLLDITRITRSKIALRRRSLELGALVRDTVEDHRVGFEAAGIALALGRPDQPLYVIADATRLAQVIGNLLGNALKFTPRGGRVDVTLARDANTSVLRIRDTGVGIDREVLAELFVPFAQGRQPLDRTAGGLGLGLALARQLVELHGGTVSVASEGPGTGTELTVRLPLGEAAAEVAPAPVAGSGVRRRVLVIEDNLDAADSLRALLEMNGHEVRVAHDGPSGVTVARAFRPQIVFCDLGLPGMSGYEVSRALQADASMANVMLVALSGYAQPDDRVRSAAAGFGYHVAKPATRHELQAVIDLLPRTDPS